MPPNVKFPPGVIQNDYDPNEIILANKTPGNRRQQRRRQPSFAGIGVNGSQGEGFFSQVVLENDGELALPPDANNEVLVADNEEDEHTKEEDGEAQVHQYIREMSNLISEPIQRVVDEKRLSVAVNEAGENSFGVSAIEVFELDANSGLLVCPRGGWWKSSSASANTALFKINRRHESQIVTVVPGVDIAGCLWSMSLSEINCKMFGKTKSTGSDSNVTTSESAASLQWHHQPTNALVWREIGGLVEDPNSPKGRSLPLLQEAGIEFAAGVPFRSHGHEGIVVYYAQSGIKRDALSNVANEHYLKHSAEYIGFTIAISHARRAAVAVKMSVNDPRIIQVSPEDGSKEDVECGPKNLAEIENKGRHLKEDSNPYLLWLRQCVKVWHNKCSGGGMQIPPSLSTQQSLWTIFGVFCGLLTLSSLNELFEDLSNEEYFLLLGPFGALMTMQYGLPAEPASQPRNVILGQIVAGAVSMVFTYIPDHILPSWLRLAIAPAFAIGAMVKIGVPHPTAGAHAVIYAAGNHGWIFYALVVLCSIVSILPAIIVNNMSEKRQYPMYWGYLPNYLYRKLKGFVSPRATDGTKIKDMLLH